MAQRAVVVAADELGYGDAGVPLVGGGKSVSPLSLMAELGPSLGHLSHGEVEATARKVLRLLDTLEDHDDVQKVYHNAEVPEEAYRE